MKYKGFTTKELLMVLAVITLLCLIVIPPYYSLKSARRKARFERFVTQMNQKLSEQEDPIQELDQNPNQSLCTSCFSNLVKNGINNSQWFKKDKDTYLFSVCNLDEKSAEENADYSVKFDSQKQSIMFSLLK